MRPKASERSKYLLGTALVLALLIGGGTARGLYTDGIIILFSIIAAAGVLSTPTVQRIDPLPVGLVALATLLCIVQIIPLPSGLLAPLRPEFLDHPVGADAGATFVSLGLGRTIESLWLILAPLGFFLCVLRLRPDQVNGLLPFFFLGLLCNLLVGTLQYSLSKDAVVEDFLPFAISAGLFANVNHFSALLFVSIPLIVYFGLFKGHPAIGGSGLIAILLLLLAAGSRAGVLIGLAITLISLFVLSARSRFTLAAVISVFIVLSIYTVGAWSKIDTDNLDPEFGRREFARTTLEGIRENWVLGIGFGNFVKGYQIYENPEMIQRKYVNHAHNEYLELVFEGGFAAALLIGLYFFLLATAAFSPEASALQRAALISIVFLLIHSLVDYPLRTMALAMTFAFLNGILFHTGLRPLAHKKENLLEVEHNGEKLLVPIAREQPR